MWMKFFWSQTGRLSENWGGPPISAKFLGKYTRKKGAGEGSTPLADSGPLLCHSFQRIVMVPGPMVMGKSEIWARNKKNRKKRLLHWLLTVQKTLIWRYIIFMSKNTIDIRSRKQLTSAQSRWGSMFSGKVVLGDWGLVVAEALTQWSCSTSPPPFSPLFGNYKYNLQTGQF